MLTEIWDQVFEKTSDYLSKPENTAKISEKLVAPILQTLSTRFQWLFACLQALAALVIIQTILLVWVFIMVRKLGN